MKKFVLAPDSFKGTMSSKEVCVAMAEKIKERFPDAKIVSIPVADGGEGSVDCFLTAIGGTLVNCKCKNPYFEDIDGYYGIIDQKGVKTAIVEMSAAAGLPMVEGRKNPLVTTTYGVGQLIEDAIKNNCKKVIIALGGSCTNDFGAGMAAALGVKFFDKDGKQFIPVGQTLSLIEKIDLTSLSEKVNGVEFVTMCDIDNLPYGETGAARVFAPQKGADEKAVELLDEGVKHVCDVYLKQYGVDLSTLKGGGAAGAMGAGTVAFLNSRMDMGIDVVLETVDFDNVIKDADYIFTGEGKIDGQSLRGKVVIGISRRAKKQNVPVISVVGGAEGDMTEAYNQGVNAIFAINRLPQDFSISRYNSLDNLKFTMENILRLINL